MISQPSGAGAIVAFTQGPTIRAYRDGLNIILMNAIFRVSAYTGSSR